MIFLPTNGSVPNAEMPPATVTQTLEPQVTSAESVACKLRRNVKSTDLTKHTDQTYPGNDTETAPETQACPEKDTEIPCTYDLALSKLPQPWFLKPVREWEKRYGFVTPVRWTNTILITSFHLLVACWLFKCYYTNSLAKWQTCLFGYIMGQVSGFGVTAGAHRHWCHRSYKARWPLKIILMICYSVSGQNTIYEWVRDHRVHHKFSETTADPHDANRGFFFAHIGWLMMKKHPDVIREGQKIDMSDIVNDPFVQFQTRYFMVLKVLCCWILPSMLPYYGWNESAEISFVSQALVRYILSLHFTWSVNSFAHLWGNKPYDRYIMPAENRGVSIVAMGEGWHNYHHTFPWDYKAAELGVTNNVTTTILDFFARIGWAYDLKVASPALVKAVAKSRGDHTESLKAAC